MQEKIIFVHQPKTGGANFAQILKNTYGKKNVYRDKDKAKGRLDEYLSEQGEKITTPEDIFYERQRYKVIYGHFSPLKYKDNFPDAFYLTFYRDPIQRIVSHYHYWKRTEIHDLRSVNPLRIRFIEEKQSLKEFAKMIKEDRVKEGHLETFAVENFNFIGIMEEYQKSLQLLKHKKLPELIYFEDDNFNANPDKSTKEKYEIEDQEFFKDLFKEELKQYQQAVELFNRNYKASRLK